MKKKYLLILFFPLLVIFIYIVLMNYSGDMGIGMMERMKQSQIVSIMSSIRTDMEPLIIQKNIDTHLPRLYQKWNKLLPSDIEQLVIGQHGEIIIISYSMDVVAIFTPNKQSKEWQCRVISKNSMRDLLCDHFPLKFR